MSADNRNLAIEFAKAQAAIKPMTPVELMEYINEIESRMDNNSSLPATDATAQFVVDPASAIKEKTITCAICGKSFKLLSKQHLESHGHTPDSYRELCGYKKKQPLAAKAQTRDRRKRMQDMKLWERRDRTKEVAPAVTPTPAKPAASKAEVTKAPAAPATDKK